MTRFVRFAGWRLIAVGLLVTPTVFHPDIFDISIGEASLMPYWTAGHAAGLVAMVLTMFGLAGLVARFGARLGALGLTGIIVAVPGIVLTACAAYLRHSCYLRWPGSTRSLWTFRGRCSGLGPSGCLAGLRCCGWLG